MMKHIQNKHKWSVYVADPEKDRDLIVRAYESFFGKHDETYVDWLYYDNPAGPLYCAFALDGEIIAGQYIVIPATFLFGGKQVRGSISLDTFTDSQYRHQGIFTVLAETVYSRLAKEMVTLTIGQPNNNSRPGFLAKLGFTEPYSACVMVRPLSPVPGHSPITGRASGKIPLGFMNSALGRLRGLRMEMSDIPDRDVIDILWNTYSKRTKFSLEKSSSWTYWRYASNPRFSYRFIMATQEGKPAGYVVWNKKLLSIKKGYVAATLMDVVATDTWTAVSLVQAFIEEVACVAQFVKALTALWGADCIPLLMGGFIPVKPISIILRVHDRQLAKTQTFRNSTLPIGYNLTDGY
jgi:hypothetical protein